jgi:hypothetical protein
MIWEAPTINLFVAWIWILAGFGSGALLGLRFAREQWLGGYASLRRRMYRLGHISFFGLGFLNLMFFLTVKAVPGFEGPMLTLASWLLVLGALTMPACCLALAHHPNAKPQNLFSVPVGSLLVGGGLTVWMLVTS